MTLRIIAIAALASALSAASATAQSTSHNPFQFGTTLSGFGGATVDSESTAPAAGLELGWEITHHLAVEGATLWSFPGNGEQDFGVMIGPRFNLAHHRRHIPFVTAAVGMYRASFDNLTAELPPFYDSRVSPANRTGKSGTFDDFLASIGGGGELFLQEHWAIRPEVRLLSVINGSDVRWITSFGAHVVYHFERHPLSD